MGTNMIQARQSYGEKISILASGDFLAYQSTTLDLASLVSDSDGKKSLPSGTFLQEPFAFTPVGSTTPVMVSVVPFAKMGATVGNTIALGERALSFLPGMQVAIPGAGYNNITLSGTFAAGDTATFTLFAGSAAVVTAVAGDTAATMAIKLAAAINNSQSLGRYVSASTNGAVVHLMYTTERVFASTATETGAASTITLLDANKLQDYSLGTVQSVSPSGVVTLTAPPTQTLPVGFPVSRPFNPNALLGITIDEVVYEYQQNTIDPLVGESNDVAAHYRATLHRARMPYWSSYLAPYLPELKFFPN